ncbi:hypothetical protein CSC33_4756 [Pseudomonas aeruginosa]|nr:hypothetical protein CSC33_4756 [Pseudomonas aeruginosa]
MGWRLLRPRFLRIIGLSPGRAASATDPAMSKSAASSSAAGSGNLCGRGASAPARRRNENGLAPLRKRHPLVAGKDHYD